MRVRGLDPEQKEQSIGSVHMFILLLDTKSSLLLEFEMLVGVFGVGQVSL